MSSEVIFLRPFLEAQMNYIKRNSVPFLIYLIEIIHITDVTIIRHGGKAYGTNTKFQKLFLFFDGGK